MQEPARPPRLVRFGTFELDLRAGELRKHGRKLKLHGQPIEVLAMLLEHPGEVVTREELQKKLWPTDTFVDFDHSLNTAINKLREALGDSAESPRFVDTVPRRGYRFIAPVETVAPVSPQAISAVAAIYDRRPATALAERRYKVLAVLGVCFVGLVVLTALPFALNIAGLRDRVLGTAPAPKIESIAVLPLENLSRDLEQEYFADGMTDALITELGKISALRVISRTSVMHYKQARKPLLEIAQELNVDALVEASVLRSGSRVRINAQLMQANPERHLWAASFERDFRDVLALQSEVARAIAREIRVTVTPEEETRLAAAPRAKPDVYEDYLKGRFFWNKRTGAGLTRGMEYFRRAIDTDPAYAPAYAGLADSYNILSFYLPVAPSEAFPKAKAAAAKALELDETLTEAHTALAWVRATHDWDWAGAEKEFLRALELNPSYAHGHSWYGWFLTWMGRHSEAMVSAERARRLDPLSLVARMHVGLVSFGARKYDQAIAEWQEVLDLDPHFARANWDLGRAYTQKGMYDDAIAQFRRAMTLSEGAPGGSAVSEAWLGHAYALAGKRKEARGIINALKERSKRMYVPPLDIAMVYAGLGEKDQAMNWLDRAYEVRSGDIVLLKVGPQWDPLRSDPRFQDLLRRMNFPPYEQ